MTAPATVEIEPPRPRRFRAPRQLRIMRPGWFYLALTVGMGMAGLNTGNNLIFLTCGLMLGVIVASGILSERCLRGLSVERRLPEAATQNRPALIGIAVKNGKRGASFGILVEDLATGGRCQFPLIGPRQVETRSYTVVPARRGRQELGTLRVATRFPFGLFEKSLRLELPEEIVVRPDPLPCALPPPGAEPQGGEAPAAAVGVGQDPWQLRPYREGEDARNIAWNASARAGRPIALDRERAERRRTALDLPERAGPELFDREVRHAAFLVQALMDAGFAVGLRQGRRRLVEEGYGPAHLGRLLDTLADSEPS